MLIGGVHVLVDQSIEFIYGCQPSNIQTHARVKYSPPFSTNQLNITALN